MKPPKIEPNWGLTFGFLIAPLICALNVTLLDGFTLGFSSRLPLEFLRSAFAALMTNGPLGFMTTRLLEIWQSGDRAKARALGIGFGVFALAFWFWWLKTLLEAQIVSPQTLAALALPFLWSILIPLFALFARRPKP